MWQLVHSQEGRSFDQQLIDRGTRKEYYCRQKKKKTGDYRGSGGFAKQKKGREIFGKGERRGKNVGVQEREPG